MTKRNSVLLTVIIFIIFISLGLPDSIMGSGWPSIRRDFGLQARDLSLYTSVALIFSMLTSYFYPKLNKVFNLYQIIAISILSVVIGLFILAIVPNAFVLYFAFPFLGVGQGAIDVAVNLFAAKNFSKSLMSYLHGFYGIGASLSSAFVALFLSTEIGWRGAVFAVFILQVIILFLVFRYRTLFFTKMEVENESKVQMVHLELKHYYAPLFHFFCGIELVIGAFLSTYMKEIHHLSDASAATMTAVYLFAFTFGRFLNGAIARFFTEKKLFMFQFAITFLGIILLSNVPIVASFLIGYGSSTLFPMMISVPHHYYTANLADRIVNLQMTFANAGYLLLPIFCGFLLQQVGFSYFPVILGINLFILVILVELIISKKKVD